MLSSQASSLRSLLSGSLVLLGLAALWLLAPVFTSVHTHGGGGCRRSALRDVFFRPTRLFCEPLVALDFDDGWVNAYSYGRRARSCSRGSGPTGSCRGETLGGSAPAAAPAALAAAAAAAAAGG